MRLQNFFKRKESKYIFMNRFKKWLENVTWFIYEMSSKWILFVTRSNENDGCPCGDLINGNDIGRFSIKTGDSTIKIYRKK